MCTLYYKSYTYVAINPNPKIPTETSKARYNLDKSLSVNASRSISISLDSNPKYNKCQPDKKFLNPCVIWLPCIKVLLEFVAVLVLGRDRVRLNTNSTLMLE